jgi:hypothetical protein
MSLVIEPEVLSCGTPYHFGCITSGTGVPNAAQYMETGAGHAAALGADPRAYYITQTTAAARLVLHAKPGTTVNGATLRFEIWKSTDGGANFSATGVYLDVLVTARIGSMVGSVNFADGDLLAVKENIQSNTVGTGMNAPTVTVILS